MKGKRIVLIRFSSMGDVAMVVPVLRAFLQAYPDIQVTVITKKFFVPIFKSLPVECIGADTHGKHKGITGLWRLAGEIRILKPDLVLDLHQVLRSKILRLLIGVPAFTLDKNRKAKKALIRKQNKIFKPLPSVFQLYKTVFNQAGFSFSLDKVGFPPKPIAYTRLPQHKPWIGIAPFAQYIAKELSIEKTKWLIQNILEKQNVTILLFGGPQERERLKPLIIDTKHVISIPDLQLSFTEELDIIANLNLMVGMDSGNGHLAALYGIPVITFWGVTHPYTGFAPFQQPEKNRFTADRKSYPLIPTSIYGNKYPLGYERAIDSVDIYKALERILFIIQSTRKKLE